MFYELMLPEISNSSAPKCWVPVMDDQLEMFLRVDGAVDDGNGDKVEYLFNTFDDAVLTSAVYYRRNGHEYPYTPELRDAENRIPIEYTFEYLESKVMRFG